MIKGVAFDFDCTLYKREDAWARLTQPFIRRFAKNIHPSLQASDVQNILCRCDADGLAQDETWPEIFVRFVRSGLFAEPVTFEEFYDFIQAEFPSAIALRDDAADCLAELTRRGFTTGLFTNGEADYSRSKLHASGTDALVDHILCSGAVGIAKPDPGAFAALAESMGLRAEEIAFVGDHPRNDIMGAKGAGMTAIWLMDVVPWPADAETPEYVAHTLTEALSIVNKINNNA